MSHFTISKAVISKDGKFLLLKRAAHSKTFPNTWDFAGGKGEPGKSPEEAVVRETKEETSLNVTITNLLASLTYEEDKYHANFHYFIPQSISGILKISNDHSDFCWVSLDEIKSLPLHPSVKIFLEKKLFSNPI